MSVSFKFGVQLAAAGLMCLFASSAAADHKRLKLDFNPQTKNLTLKWYGKIDRPMARQLQDAIEDYEGRADKIILTLSSDGGRVSEARKVISILRAYKKTHGLDTRIMPGRICGSMCVPIFLQGQERAASEASLWLFHEISVHDRKTGKTVELRPIKTRRMFKDYFIPAGVPQKWLTALADKIKGNDIWLTGRQLVSDKSRIITTIISNQKRRKIYARSISLESHRGL